MGREKVTVDPWLAASATVDIITMSKVMIPSGAILTGALSRTRGTGTRAYCVLWSVEEGHDGAENMPVQDRRDMPIEIAMRRNLPRPIRL
jgi:hypothetical protein